MGKLIRRFMSLTNLSLVAALALLAAPQANAQCTELTSGLLGPLSIVGSNQGNLIVSESGTATPNTGRISIVEPSGNRRTLISGLPSGINDVNEPGGPSGLFMQGRTVYVAISVGDVGRTLVLPPPLPPVTIPNPNPISSPLFSSILAIHFSATAREHHIRIRTYSRRSERNCRWSYSDSFKRRRGQDINQNGCGFS